jgi:hypothetical protein
MKRQRIRDQSTEDDTVGRYSTATDDGDEVGKI